MAPKSTPAATDAADADAIIRGRTCEDVIRDLATVESGDPYVRAVIGALVRRYDAKAARREAHAAAPVIA